MKKLYKIEERVAPVVAFHGTSDTFLRTILKQGMLPDPKNKTWQDDQNTSLSLISRSSLYGSYWTTNLMTAISSSTNTVKKFGGYPIYVIASLIPESAFADEDSLTYKFIYAVSDGLRDNKYLSTDASQLGLIFGDPSYKSILDDIASDSAEYFHKQLYKDNTQKPVPYEVFKFAVVAYIERQAVFGESNIDWKRAYDDGFRYSTNGKQEISWDDIPLPTELFGSKSEVESRFKKAQDMLTKYYRDLALKTRQAGGNNTLRITDPVTYSGRNRILAIVQNLGYVSEDDFTSQLRVVYGSVPQEFIRQYQEKMGKYVFVK